MSRFSTVPLDRLTRSMDSKMRGEIHPEMDQSKPVPKVASKKVSPTVPIGARRSISGVTTRRASIGGAVLVAPIEKKIKIKKSVLKSCLMSSPEESSNPADGEDSPVVSTRRRRSVAINEEKNTELEVSLYLTPEDVYSDEPVVVEPVHTMKPATAHKNTPRYTKSTALTANIQVETTPIADVSEVVAPCLDESELLGAKIQFSHHTDHNISKFNAEQEQKELEIKKESAKIELESKRKAFIQSIFIAQSPSAIKKSSNHAEVAEQLVNNVFNKYKESKSSSSLGRVENKLKLLNIRHDKLKTRLDHAEELNMHIDDLEEENKTDKEIAEIKQFLTPSVTIKSAEVELVSVPARSNRKENVVVMDSQVMERALSIEQAILLRVEQAEAENALDSLMKEILE